MSRCPFFREWVNARAPESWRPWLQLARVDRPAGFWLLMWPCWWAVALASHGWPDWTLLGLFAAGAVVMRSAGCIVNDIVDRRIDARVERTRDRPLASGAVTLRGALVFLGLLLAAGLTVLLQFNQAAIITGIASLGLVVIYPFMKRVTYWPQLFLGLAFSWGALVGWVAVRGALSPEPLVLYLAAIAWTIGYDTIYAHQDKTDDERIGVKSTALAFGESTKLLTGLFYAIFVAGAALAGYQAGTGWPFLVVLAIAAADLARQLVTVDLDDPGSCLRAFSANNRIGLLVFAGLVAGRLVPFTP
ncbi:MAG: 4-hydroxybenzoate octaprenyltransferase [bacterium]|nr:4-hydroxybenzoate octaprenyltransferase [bacterium]